MSKSFVCRSSWSREPVCVVVVTLDELSKYQLWDQHHSATMCYHTRSIWVAMGGEHLEDGGGTDLANSIGVGGGGGLGAQVDG